ncbi:ferric reductase-like transmembrane domain-containing protein [Polyangium sp. y55x31]|uniref:ferric reductase-like transmembrane domain-containing protein n=1 Tax=Polyangium sp. y55x31 TaxID=3042688 RepID=UPI002482452D|nr:ferric reductase-like transmembrane domain-containing protein [Polyangium sp. y55x31]MDI1475366.1 ferric reductase-like transmembrane domain-containing protein [Polyangium sp. y55x31]
MQKLPSWTPVLVAAALAVAPAFTWACSAGADVLTWYGFARFAGFAAAGLFAVSMLLMLRLSWLDRAFRGLGHVYQAHHALGVAALLLLLVHPLALALGAFLVEPAAALHLLWPNPSSKVVFSGWLSLLLFLIFFVVTVAQHMPFHRWRRLHRALGLAYAAMVWHLVTTFSGSVAAGLALGLVAAGVLGFAHRLLAEDPPRRGLRYRITDVRRRGPKVVDLVLEPLDKKLRFEAGQFVYLAMRDSPDYEACGESHPYTLTGHPDDPRIQVSVKALGFCTRHIQEVTVGTEAAVQGPFGGLFPAKTHDRPQVWIGGGIGVTPFLGRASVIAADGPSLDIVYCAGNEGAALYLEDLRAFTRARPDMRVHTIYEDTDGLPTVPAIESRVGSLEGKEIMIAGPPAMVEALRRALRARGVPASRIHTEEGMAR